MKQRRRRVKAAQHHEALAEAERQIDAAVDNDLLTPQPLLPLLPAGEASSPSSADPPRPPPNRSLEFYDPTHPPAAALTEPAHDSASPPDSPKINCSQYRQAQHDENKIAVLHDKVNDWRQRCASPEVAEVPDRYRDQTLPTIITVQEKVSDRRRRNELVQQPIFKCDRDLQLYVRADHRNPEGQAPLCYVATGYQGDPAPDGEPHQGYMVYNKSDLLWARRLKFHLRRLQA